jgi:predicted MFS family arabinose efflux permease
MPYSDTPLLITLSAGVLVGLGLAGGSFSLIVAVFGRRVPADKRSWAMGLATASGSLGQFLFAPMGQGFISAWGWSSALLLLAASLAVVPLLAAVLRNDGSTRSDADSPEMSIVDTLRHAFGHRSYVLLVLGFFTCGFQLAFITVHLPPYLTDIGVSAQLASWSIGMIGLFNVIGAYSSGVAGGRWSKKNLLAWIYLARAFAIALFISLPMSAYSVLVFAAAIGLLWLSTVPLTSGLVVTMFGTRYMAMLYGLVFLSHQIGGFIGVWLGGVMYTETGSYALVWWLAVVLSVISAVLHLPIAERRAPLLVSS